MLTTAERSLKRPSAGVVARPAARVGGAPSG